MEEYNEQCKIVRRKVEKAIEKGVSIVICGPEFSGKTHIRNILDILLQQNDYTVYYGVDDYKECNKFHGKTYTDDKFWIEEINNNALSDILNHYEYIETTLQYPDMSK